MALGFIFLFTFALGLGQIFIALGTFSSLIKKIPRSGPWLDITKSVFGTVMLAMALYYIEPVASERVFAGALSAFCIFVATILGAFRPTQPKQFLSQLNKAFFLVVFCIGLIFAIKCVFWSEWNQLQSRRTTSPQKKNSFWTPYSDEALKKAQRKGQPVILDFYADWCAACKDLDKKTFSTAEVQSKTKGFLWLKFDATNDSKKLTELQGKYGIQGLPTVILYDAKGRYRKELTLTGFESRQEFIKRVQKLTRL